MTDLRAVPSAEFRVVYTRLEEPVAVTSVGRVIGYYYPAEPAPRPVHPDPEVVLTDDDREGHAGSPAGGQTEASVRGLSAPPAGRSGRPGSTLEQAPARRSNVTAFPRPVPKPGSRS